MTQRLTVETIYHNRLAAGQKKGGGIPPPLRLFCDAELIEDEGEIEGLVSKSIVAAG